MADQVCINLYFLILGNCKTRFYIKKFISYTWTLTFTCRRLLQKRKTRLYNRFTRGKLLFYNPILRLIWLNLQNERAFQRQPTIFLNRKKGVGPKRRKSLRYHREVGLGFKTPREVHKIRSLIYVFFYLD